MTSPLKIGLIGFGNIGTGVVRHLSEYGDAINARLPRPIELAMICDRDLIRDRGVSTAGIELTSDYRDIIRHPEIEVVIELIGGTKIAREVVLEALTAGKHVVTANKALVATYGGELFHAADDHNVHLLFEASVGAGIPLIRTLQSSLLPDTVSALHGILNGTCNFILSAMEDKPGTDFQDVLEEAMRLGYAEPDPTLDIEGHDAAHKIAIMGSLVYGHDYRFDDVVVQGITRISPIDFEFAASRQQTIKLLATATRDERGIVSLSVWPTLVPADHLVGRVRGVVNTLWVEAQPIGPTMYTGAGAGQGSTSSGVLADVCHIAQAADNTTIARLNPLRIPHHTRVPLDPTGVTHPPRYVRAMTTDAKAVAAAAGLPVLQTSDKHIVLAAPAQNARDRAAMLAALASSGATEDAVAEIRVAFQDPADVLKA